MKFTMLLALSLAVAGGLEWEREMGIPETDAIVPEDKAVQPISDDDTVLAQSRMYADLLDHAKILEAVARLRAYCIIAQPAAEDFANKHKTSGIVDFVEEFGKVEFDKPAPPPPDPDLPHDIPGLPVELPTEALLHPSKKPKMKGNIVLLYSAAMGKAKRHYGEMGMGKYMLGNIEQAVLSGHDVTTVYSSKHDKTQIVGINHEILGLTTNPDYLHDMSVSMMDYEQKLPEVVEQASDADSVAATMWLQKGGQAEYKSFLQKELDAHKETADEYNKKVIDGVLAVIHDSMTKTMDVTAPPEEAAAYLETLPAPNITDLAELKKRAQDSADAWEADAAKVGEAELVGKGVHDLEEVTPAPTPDPYAVHPDDSVGIYTTPEDSADA